MASIKKFEALLASHRRLALDTSIFIYLFEQHQKYAHLCAKVIDRFDEGRSDGIASSIAISEILTLPMKQKNAEIVSLYEHVFRSLPHFSFIDIDYAAAKAAAVLRAEYGILLADALHIACAMKGGATVFITNDKKLKRMKDIAIACLADYV